MSPEGFDAAMAAVLRGARAEDLVTAAGGDVSRLERYVGHYLAACVERLGLEHPGLRAALGETAFAARAVAYGRAEPPALADGLRFGAGFAPWLAKSEPPLTDWMLEVASLDWRMEACGRAAIVPALGREALGRAGLGPDSVLTLDSAASWVRALHRIGDWYAATLAGHTPSAPEAGRELIELRRDGRRVGLRELTPGAFAFRDALARGQTLGAAADGAATADAAFDLAAALSDLADEGLVVAAGSGPQP